MTAIKKQPDIKFDCKYYLGYKPCGKSLTCKDCQFYVPMGKRILIIKLGAMGDVLRTTPLLRALKRKYPRSHISWLTDAGSSELLFNNPFIDRLLIFRLDNIIPLLAEKFDLVISLDKEKSALALAQLVKAKKKLGFSLTEFGTLGIFNRESEYALMLGLSDELKFKLNKKSYQQIIFQMVGLRYAGEEYVLELSERSKQTTENFRQQYKLQRYDQVVGIHTGSGSVFRTKAWTIKGWTELIEELNHLPATAIILMGGAAESEFNFRFKAVLNRRRLRIIDAGCQNSLADFIGILNCCDVVVGLDSLAMHLAIALKKKVVAIFGPTCPQEIDLYGNGKIVVAESDCAPCYRQYCDKLPRCMDKLSGRVVARAVCELLLPAPTNKSARVKKRA